MQGHILHLLYLGKFVVAAKVTANGVNSNSLFCEVETQMRKWLQNITDEEGIVKRPVRVLSIIGILSIALAGAVFLYYHSPENNMWLICIVYRLCGYYCPGCGAGRACYSLLHGRFYQAFRYNPLLCLLLPWFGLYFFICMVQWLIYGRETVSQKIPAWVTYVILIIVVFYGIFRNIEGYPFCLLAPVRVRSFLEIN